MSKMQETWGKFWKSKGSGMEWDQEAILKSKNLNEIFRIVKSYFHPTSIKGLELLELGSGMGITSLFFASKGVNVSLLDNSLEVQPLAQKYWSGYSKHKFILSDLFDFNTKIKYDIVSSFGLCEHFDGKKRVEVLKKHLDLLRKGGVAIISVPYKYGIFYRLAKKLAEMTGMWDFGLEIPFSKSELVNFSRRNNLDYTILFNGFYSSVYDLFVRKPLKVLKVNIKRRFDNVKSIWDNLFGSGIILVARKNY